jgi:hypothetical protein
MSGSLRRKSRHRFGTNVPGAGRLFNRWRLALGQGVVFLLHGFQDQCLYFCGTFCYFSPSQHLAELLLAYNIMSASKVSADAKAAFF